MISIIFLLLFVSISTIISIVDLMIVCIIYQCFNKLIIKDFADLIILTMIPILNLIFLIFVIPFKCIKLVYNCLMNEYK